MPYPAKLTAEKILETALMLFEKGGPDALAMRPLADALGVRPSSLYRYYPERDALLGALEAHATRALHAAIRDATQYETPEAALTAAAHAYLGYARAHPHLYALLLRPRAPYRAEPGPGKDLWNEVLALVGAVTGNPDDTAATVAFWAFLHGFTLLERSGQFGSSGPQGGFERGLLALISGFKQSKSCSRV
jgi:AcrR family transcriptional regulator